MSDLLASFRELSGINPATEARLHQAGVYTWEALAEILDALGDIKASTPRELIDQISAQESDPERSCASWPPNGERSEAFIVRLSLSGDGQPIRCTVTNVRTETEQAWTGWAPKGVIRFIQEQAAIAVRPVVVPVEDTGTRPVPAVGASGSWDHVQVLHAGTVIGGRRRNVDLEVRTARVPDLAEFTYKATLQGRGYGPPGQDWTVLAVHTGTAQPPKSLQLHFEGVELPRGIQRLRVQLAARLSIPQRQALALQVR